MLTIYKDEKFKKLGYDNCDSNTNGEFYVVDELILDNMVVFDIGANVGAWSKHLLSKNKQIDLFCFEPVKSTYDVLCRNFQQNKNVKCFNYAVSKDNEDKTFYFYGPTLQLSELSSLYKRGDDIEHRFNLKHTKITVNCTTVDDFCKTNNIDKINFLKIDTEGAEFDVLTGCKDMILNNNIDYIQFEYGGCCLDSNQKLFNIYTMLKKKYNVYKIIFDGLYYMNKWDSCFENYLYSNYLAIHK